MRWVSVTLKGKQKSTTLKNILKTQLRFDDFVTVKEKDYSAVINALRDLKMWKVVVSTTGKPDTFDMVDIAYTIESTNGKATPPTIAITY